MRNRSGSNRAFYFALVIFTLSLLTTGGIALADDDFVPTYHPTINISRAPGDINIDGNLNDPGWKNAARATDFCEFAPGDMTRPSVRSEAMVTYDETNFYLAFIAWDDPEDVRVSLRERDNIFRDDYCGILFDTYGDLSWGYEIFLNPLGIQGDLRQLSSGNEDMSFDIVFYSEGMVTDSGYQVEVAIPFSSLRFPNKEEQVWRVNFWRDQQRELRRRYSWAAHDRDDPCWMCQWGTLTGIKGVRPSSNIELLPNVIAFQSGERQYNVDSTGSDFDNSDLDGDVSFNARWGITSDASLEATINPDFSQVESDEAQIDVNSTFALFYSEQRPFFQRGSDMFDGFINAIYTRSINDPQVAAKLTGSIDGTSGAYMFARDENTPIVLPFEERSRFRLLGRSTSNIMRVKHTLGDYTYVGGIVTDRRLDDGGSGTLAGVDSRISFLKNYRIDAQFLFSHTKEADGVAISPEGETLTFDRGKYTWDLDGESYSGHAAFLRLTRSARFWSYQAAYQTYSPTFRTDNGFTTQNDFQMINLWTNLDFRPNRHWLVRWQPSVYYGRKANFNRSFSVLRDEWVNCSINAVLRGQTNLYLNYLNSREQYRGHVHEGISRGTINIDTRFSEIISGGLGTTFGRSISRNSTDSSVMGDMFDFEVWVQVKPTQRLLVTPSFEYASMDHSDRYLIDHPGTEKEIYEGYILYTRLDYQFTRELFLRLIVQYDDFSEALSIEPLLTYQINPFTVFYIGAKQDRWDWQYRPEAGSSEWTDPRSELSSQQFFAKFQYLFRM